MIRLVTPLRLLLARRELIGELARRELRDRHSGQILGLAWAFGHPLMLMLLYTLLFAYVFPARSGATGSILDYSVNVFAGLVPWLAFQDLLSRAPSVLVGHANLVKQIVFPTEVLPVKSMLAGIAPYAIPAIFAIGYAGWHGTLGSLAWMLPVVIALQLIAMVGAAFLLSAAGVFFRDLRDLITVFCSVNLFAQPILYNPFATPAWLDWIFAFNPFSYLVWCWQDVLFHGRITHTDAWLVLPLGSIGVFLLGWAVFEKTRHGFGDAL